uniref:Transmembrane protein 50A n=1 Tax=Brassica campestris TaxID=3711 RepID=A0A3P5ZFD4_BRACM|nr:unnamed protein product [Brassica rapa]
MNAQLGDRSLVEAPPRDIEEDNGVVDIADGHNHSDDDSNSSGDDDGADNCVDEKDVEDNDGLINRASRYGRAEHGGVMRRRCFNDESAIRSETDHLAMDLAELWAIFGPGFSGAVFGTGWWFWVDAVVCSSIQVPFLHYLPGIFASLGALMFNCVRKEDIDYSPYDEGEWRLKLWLFIAYVVAFVSLAASVGLLIQDSVVKTGPSTWTGVAGVFQCVFVLISGLMYWTSHSE